MFSVMGSHDIAYTFDDGTIVQYDLQRQHTLVSRFDNVFGAVNGILEQHPEVRMRFEQYLRYLNEERTDAAINSINDLQPIVFPIAEARGLFNYAYSEPPSKQTALHIDSAEYRIIMETSFMLKMFGSVLSHFRQTNMALVRAVYSRLCDRFVSCGVLHKVERIIDSVVMGNAARGLDLKSMLWVVFATSKGYEPNNVSLRERNNILYKGITTLAPGKDPVKYIVSMARTALGFQMRDRISVVNIATNVPIESVYESTSNVLETFVYEEVTANRSLIRLVTEYEFASKLKNKNVEPITAILAAPFVCRVLDVPTLNLTHISNPLLLNLLVYRFMSEAEPSWILFNFLRCYCKMRYDTGEADPALGCGRPDLTQSFSVPMSDEDGRRFFISNQLAAKVRNYIKQSKFADTSTYTSKQLCECVSRMVRKLLSYDFYDHFGNNVPITRYAVIVSEYVEYLCGLSTGRYDGVILNAKHYLRNEVKGDVRARIDSIDRRCASWAVLEDESPESEENLSDIQTHA